MNAPTDPYLEERLRRYDRWVAQGRIPVSSRVVPVRESLSTQQWVLPTEQVLERDPVGRLLEDIHDLGLDSPLAQQLRIWRDLAQRWL